jgi:hypothetical protein
MTARLQNSLPFDELKEDSRNLREHRCLFELDYAAFQTEAEAMDLDLSYEIEWTELKKFSPEQFMELTRLLRLALEERHLGMCKWHKYLCEKFGDVIPDLPLLLTTKEFRAMERDILDQDYPEFFDAQHAERD